jgi:hypothetical protein
MMRRPRGIGKGELTLLEIMLAVGIAVVFMGGEVVFLSSTGGDRDLETARRLFEDRAGKGREVALQSGVAQRILLNKEAVGGEAFPTGVEMMIVTPLNRSKGRNGWTTPEDYQWLITGGGVVEPIRVLLKHNENEEQFSFSALTGESVTEPRVKK